MHTSGCGFKVEVGGAAEDTQAFQPDNTLAGRAMYLSNFDCAKMHGLIQPVTCQLAEVNCMPSKVHMDTSAATMYANAQCQDSLIHMS